LTKSGISYTIRYKESDGSNNKYGWIDNETACSLQSYGSGEITIYSPSSTFADGMSFYLDSSGSQIVDIVANQYYYYPDENKSFMWVAGNTISNSAICLTITQTPTPSTTSENTPTPTPTPSVTLENTPTPTPTLTKTPTPTHTSTKTPSHTPTSTNSTHPTPTPNYNNHSVVGGFNLVSNIGHINPVASLEDNLKSFLDWSFLNIGAFVNITIPDSGISGGAFHQLKPVLDPSLPQNRVWEAPRKDWVYESGIVHNGNSPIDISGIYLNNTFIDFF
jgi:hypothetical protein